MHTWSCGRLCMKASCKLAVTHYSGQKWRHRPTQLSAVLWPRQRHKSNKCWFIKWNKYRTCGTCSRLYNVHIIPVEYCILLPLFPMRVHTPNGTAALSSSHYEAITDQHLLLPLRLHSYPKSQLDGNPHVRSQFESHCLWVYICVCSLLQIHWSKSLWHDTLDP